MIPTDEQIRAMHERFAPTEEAFDLVFSREDVVRQRLPLPSADYLAETDEERLVMYADKFHSKTRPPAFVAAASYAASVRRFGEDKVARFAAMVERFGEPDLPGLASRYGHQLG